jgi:hypothetical protein
LYGVLAFAGRLLTMASNHDKPPYIGLKNLPAPVAGLYGG